MNVLTYCARKRIPIHEVGIQTIYIDDNAGSHFDPVGDSFRIYRELLKFSLSSFCCFLLDYLPKQRCLSPNTILSYRQALNLFVSYMRDERGITAHDLTFSCIDRDMILGFLLWLENVRGCSASTRNQRLMALRSFLEFAGQIDCTQTALHLSACSIPSKEAHGKVVEFLTEPALTALLQQPDPSEQKGLRNLVFMILMYDTAARCGEILDMRICDLCLDAKHPIAYLHGKRRKTRIVPLLEKTVQYCKQYLHKFQRYIHDHRAKSKP